MTRCLNCNGIMKAGEKSCYGCGDRAEKTSGSPSSGGFLATLLSIAFFGSLFLTIGSLVFSDYTPPFLTCLTGSGVLLLMRMLSGGSSPKPEVPRRP